MCQACFVPFPHLDLGHAWPHLTLDTSFSYTGQAVPAWMWGPNEVVGECLRGLGRWKQGPGSW